MTYKPAEAVAAYIKIRDQKKALDDEYKARKLAFDSALDALEKFLFATMKERGEQNIPVKDVGTAYISVVNYVKMEDREKLVAFVRSTGDFSFFTNAVSKEAVLAFVDTHKQLPPGVSMETVETCNVRKT